MASSEPGKFSYQWARPAVTVDAAVVSVATATEPPKILLIKRLKDPFAGSWALPGGFVDELEPLPKAALRELEEETGIKGVQLHEVGAFGDPGRDPRGWTITVAYAGVVESATGAVGADDAAEAAWFPVGELPPLAFDHQDVVGGKDMAPSVAASTSKALLSSGAAVAYKKKSGAA